LHFGNTGHINNINNKSVIQAHLPRRVGDSLSCHQGGPDGTPINTPLKQVKLKHNADRITRSPLQYGQYADQLKLCVLA
jgi:hypothetical protein